MLAQMAAPRTGIQGGGKISRGAEIVARRGAT